MKKLLLLLMTVLLMAGTAQAQTTTYTGTIRDLSMNPVTAGQVTFTLTPSTDSTLAAQVDSPLSLITFGKRNEFRLGPLHARSR
jgi:uncharacterized lipoprotein YajG